MSLNTKAIRFPEQSYVGFDPRPGKEDDFPLGFMTEDGTDKAAEKRKNTVDKWASNSNKPRTLPNTPMVGFRLSRSVRRQSGWGSGNVKWRIEDPRGFELEISSPNLAQIISSCVIDNGVILNECRWARLAGDNVLVPTDSELYRTTKENSVRQKMAIKPSSIKVGNKIVLQNGIEGIYMGKMFELSRDYRSNGFGLCVSDKAKFVILKESSVIAYASIKPAAILDESEITVQEAEALLRQKCPSQIWVANKLTPPPVERRNLDVFEISTYNGIMLAQVQAFDNEWCVFSNSKYNNEVHFKAITPEALAAGFIEFKKWYSTSAEVSRLRAAGFRSYFSYGHTLSFKNAYAVFDTTELKCEALYRTIVTDAGNTFEVPIMC